MLKIHTLALIIGANFLYSACQADASDSHSEKSIAVNTVNTCSNTYPSYWQDMDSKFQPMWEGQSISNAPTEHYTGPVFQLSDAYPEQPVDDIKNQPWRASKFDALFDANTDTKTKTLLADEYAWLVMDYVQAGNVNQRGKEDFDVCTNPIRSWFHIPFQTYDALAGREFTHGLTREAPVTFATNAGDGYSPSTMWAVGIYNETAAYTLGTMWNKQGQAVIPTQNISFDEGAVIAKPLFNTSTIEQLPILENMPSWDANISDPTFCGCTTKIAGQSQCSLVEESQQCPRSFAQYNDVKLLQFDIAIKDSRAKGTQWVYGTFVADGIRKKDIKDPWKRISLLGLMWGNDTPKSGELAINSPKDPRKNGFEQEVIIWDTVDELNRESGQADMRQLGHLGCNQRLNGPADNANSSCMSCHGTASVPDENLATPPLVSQFSGQTKQCVDPIKQQPSVGVDRSGDLATQNNNVSFSDIDALYFANTPAATPFNMIADTASGPVNVMANDAPNYANSSSKQWISLDYSLQSSIALQQWMQWQQHVAEQSQHRITDDSKQLRRNH